MSPRAKQRPKRGRGRPPIDPSGETVQLPTVALSQAHYLELRALIDDGHGPKMSDAVRWLLEESARRRGRGAPRLDKGLG